MQHLLVMHPVEGFVGPGSIRTVNLPFARLEPRFQVGRLLVGKEAAADDLATDAQDGQGAEQGAAGGGLRRVVQERSVGDEQGVARNLRMDGLLHECLLCKCCSSVGNQPERPDHLPRPEHQHFLPHHHDHHCRFDRHPDHQRPPHYRRLLLGGFREKAGPEAVGWVEERDPPARCGGSRSSTHPTASSWTILFPETAL